MGGCLRVVFVLDRTIAHVALFLVGQAVFLRMTRTIVWFFVGGMRLLLQATDGSCSVRLGQGRQAASHPSLGIDNARHVFFRFCFEITSGSIRRHCLGTYFGAWVSR